MIYYKIKLTDCGVEVLKESKRRGKDGKGFLYVTEEELNRLESNTIDVPIDSNILKG